MERLSRNSQPYSSYRKFKAIFASPNVYSTVYRKQSLGAPVTSVILKYSSCFYSLKTIATIVNNTSQSFIWNNLSIKPKKGFHLQRTYTPRGGGVLLIMAYTGTGSAHKGYVFQTSGMWKGRVFTSWSVWKGTKICNMSVCKKAQKGLQTYFSALKKSRKPSCFLICS